MRPSLLGIINTSLNCQRIRTCLSSLEPKAAVAIKHPPSLLPVEAATGAGGVPKLDGSIITPFDRLSASQAKSVKPLSFKVNVMDLLSGLNVA